MKVVASKQGAFQPVSPAPSAVGDGFMTVTDINFNEQVPAQTSAYHSKAASHETLKVTNPLMSDFRQNGGSEVISWNYSKMEVIDASAASSPSPSLTPSTDIKPNGAVKPLAATLKKG